MVFVVQEPVARTVGAPIDISPAAKFGQFKLLLPAGDIILSPGRAIQTLRSALAGFNDDDYLLLIGDPIAIGMAVAVAASINIGRVKVLRWAKREKDYIPINIDLFPNRRQGQEAA